MPCTQHLCWLSQLTCNPGAKSHPDISTTRPSQAEVPGGVEAKSDLATDWRPPGQARRVQLAPSWSSLSRSTQPSRCLDSTGEERHYCYTLLSQVILFSTVTCWQYCNCVYDNTNKDWNLETPPLIGYISSIALLLSILVLLSFAFFFLSPSFAFIRLIFFRLILLSYSLFFFFPLILLSFALFFFFRLILLSFTLFCFVFTLVLSFYLVVPLRLALFHFSFCFLF